jgi:hypothetical protein
VRECRYVCGGRKGRGFFFPPKNYEMRLGRWWAGEDSEPDRVGGGNMFRIGGNTFYNWKNKIPMKILEFKRS